LSIGSIIVYGRRLATPSGKIINNIESGASDNKELTAIKTSVLSTGLDKLLQIHPELATIIRAWPNLPENIKATIKTLVETTSHKGEI
jgi:hypothetical protein